MSDYDAVVIGGGAAGLSAALVLSRARRAVLVVDAGEPRNAAAAHMHGFLSRDGVAPRELLQAGRDEVERYGGLVLRGRATHLSRNVRGNYEVLLADGKRLTARRVIATTGLTDELPPITGLQERFGRDVLHCPYCHGYEVRDRRIGVIGTSAASLNQAHLVRQWADDVVFFPQHLRLTDDEREQLVARAIGIVEGEVTGLLVEGDALQGVETRNDVVRRDAVFVAPTFVPNNDLLADLGCEHDGSGWTVVDGTGRTSVPGVWAAGNAVNPRAQVISAAGEGSAAAIALNFDLVEQDIRDSVTLLRLGLPFASRPHGPTLEEIS